MKKTGQILKEAREKKNLSLHEIGMSLKINPKTLQAMEEGDISKLPAKSFLRGFVKSYALYLKLEATQVLEVFNSENEPAAIPQEPSPIPSTTEEKKSEPIPPSAKKLYSGTEQNQDSFFKNKLLLSVSAAILVVLIVLTARLVDKYQKERVVDQAQIQKIQQEETLPNKEGAPVSAQIPPIISENLIATPPIVVEKKAEPKTEKPVAPPPAAPPSPTPQPVATPLPPPTPPVPPPAATTTPAKPEPTPPTDKPTEVIVEALNKVVIRYNLGDGKINTLELAPEQLHTFKSKTTVELDISDGGSVSLIVNGRERGVPGASGKPVKLVYPKQ